MYDNFAVTSQSRQSCRQQSPSSETAIMLALLARRVRMHSQQHLNDDFVKAMLAKLQSTLYMASHPMSADAVVSEWMVTEQPSWVLTHGTTVTGCDFTRL